MAADQWQALLRAKGFEEVTCYPSDQMPARILGQHVILARAPLDKRPLAGTVVTPVQAMAPPAVSAASTTTSQLQEAAPVEGLETIGTAPPQERRDKLVELVRRQLAAVLRLDARHLPEPKARLMDLGLDSLMAVELRNRLTKALGLSRKLPATLVFDYPTAEAIARFLDKEYFAPEKAPDAQPPAASPQAQGAAAKIAELSEAEVERMLMERLKRK
jgi:acyl carrier protein